MYWKIKKIWQQQWDYVQQIRKQRKPFENLKQKLKQTKAKDVHLSWTLKATKEKNRSNAQKAPQSII